ncbi:Phosphatidate cytidylyltransferase [Plasmodiophora brassicae]|uniref:Phosphatidate cytidylyltransferase n=1 Tax=Plasmodiophora brassicae TaxID=37360 RepID=A0A0G4IYY3_PLABS|nr:hypothetical protein PBRA_001622 [Plasmodiophora brassicae]SPQ93938.1 unnamed protein product [Plasmodiophora brassicae]
MSSWGGGAWWSLDEMPESAPVSEQVLIGVVAIASVLTFLFWTARCIPRGSLVDSRYQVRRKVQHAGTGAIMFTIGAIGTPRVVCSVALTVAVVLFAVVHAVRLVNANFNRWFNKTFAALLRPHERTGMPSAFYFLVGVDIVVTFFDMPIALLSCLFVSFGDPCASLAGLYFARPGSVRIRNGKSLIGALANFACCAVLAVLYLVVFQRDHAPGSVLVQAAVGALAAACAELSESRYVDDNLTIPVASAAALAALRRWAPTVVSPWRSSL